MITNMKISVEIKSQIKQIALQNILLLDPFVFFNTFFTFHMQYFITISLKYIKTGYLNRNKNTV